MKGQQPRQATTATATDLGFKEFDERLAAIDAETVRRRQQRQDTTDAISTAQAALDQAQEDRHPWARAIAVMA